MAPPQPVKKSLMKVKHEGGEDKRPHAVPKKGAGKGKTQTKTQGKHSPLKGAGKGKSQKEASQPAGGQQSYQQIRGTKIQYGPDGVARRVVKASGRDFAVNDIQTCLAHIEKFGGGQVQVQSGKGGKGGQGNAGKGSRGKGGQAAGGNAVKGGGKVIKEVIKKVNGEFVKEVWVEKGAGKGNNAHGQRGGKEQNGKAGAKGQNGRRGGKMLGVIKKEKAKHDGNGNGEETGGRRKGRGGASKRRGGAGGEPRERKERTPEELEAFKAKTLERHQQKVEKEGRELASDDTFTGEVVARAKSYAWVKPDGDLPAEVAAKLSEMNAEFRAKGDAADGKKSFLGGATDDVLYLAFADMAEEGLVLKAGVKVHFKVYTDNKGVGACEVTAA